MSLNIKLVFNSEIHRLTTLPDSFGGLVQYCRSIFPTLRAFSIKYLDEETDEITIACDDDLETAYSSAIYQGQKSLRLLLSPQDGSSRPCSEPSYSRNFSAQPPPEPKSEAPHVWSRYTCDGCDTKPIVGARFNCTVCHDFDLCETCERTKQHPHPCLKFLRPTEDQYVNIDLNPQNIFQNLMKVKQMIFDHAPKMQAKSEAEIVGEGNGEVVLMWNVRNSGKSDWPSGCKVEKVKGNLNAVFLEVPCLKVGQEGKIVARAWAEGGAVAGKWKLTTSEGFKLGKITAKGSIKIEMAEKIAEIVSMGFGFEQARDALIKNKGDVSNAVLSLLSA